MIWGNILYFYIAIGLVIVLGAVLVAGALGRARSVKRFGEEQRVLGLRTYDASMRRAVKGVLLVVAVFCAFASAAQPRYGEGSRVIPATNLDVVLVLDFSKSMYAQDVQPSRIFRAKVEIARLIKQLGGARFAAVAFAGEPMAFPLTADGAAIAQFLRQLAPNDMPVGGTAISRALREANNMLRRDPKASQHKRVIVLITDGEDLEGNPVMAAGDIAEEGTTIHVVQIGGRTPERIPEVDEAGNVVGWRTGRDGRPLMTSLSAEGESDLQKIAASSSGGVLIRAEKGTTGIDRIAAELRRQMKGELGERVEQVYADIYHYPLIIALLLLLMEALIPEAPRRRLRPKAPPPQRSRLRKRRRGESLLKDAHQEGSGV